MKVNAVRLERALSIVRAFRARGFSLEAAFAACAVVLELDSLEFSTVHAAVGLR